MIKNQKGQALLIIVLVMVVALTITLSVVSRAVVNLRTTQEQVDSQKALSAAEAGVEKEIQNIASGNTTCSGTNCSGNLGGTTFNTSSVTVGNSNQFVVSGGQDLKQDEGTYVWLSKYDTTNNKPNWSTNWTGNITFGWNGAADLEIAVIYTTNTANPVANSVIKRYIYQTTSHSVNGTPANAGGTIAGVTFDHFTASIPITNGLLIRIIPLYANTKAGVSGTPAAGNYALPEQGKIITSTGTVGTSNTQRKVTVFQGFPELPADFFPYSLLIP